MVGDGVIEGNKASKQWLKRMLLAVPAGAVLWYFLPLGLFLVALLVVVVLFMVL